MAKQVLYGFSAMHPSDDDFDAPLGLCVLEDRSGQFGHLIQDLGGPQTRLLQAACDDAAAFASEADTQVGALPLLELRGRELRIIVGAPVPPAPARKKRRQPVTPEVEAQPDRAPAVLAFCAFALACAGAALHFV